MAGKDVRAYDDTTGVLLWHSTLKGVSETAPSFSDGRLFVGLQFRRAGRVVALDPATGHVLWSRWEPQGVVASVNATSGRVYVAGRDGLLEARSQATGNLLWRDNFSGPMSSPTVPGSVVVVTTGGGSHLVAVKPTTGATIWSVTIGSGLGFSADAFSSAAIGGVVYAGSISGSLTAVRVATGQVLWEVSLGSAVFRAIAVDVGAVFATTDDNQFFALDRSDGAILWSRSWPAISPEVAVANGVVYVGTNKYEPSPWDPSLQLLNEADGATIATISLGGMYEPMGPAVSNGHVFLAQWDRVMSLGT